MDKKRILKSIIVSNAIDAGSWGLECSEHVQRCNECGSNLFYVKIAWGIVDEATMMDFKVASYKKYYSVREIGLRLYCAECGDFLEHYDKYFYPKDYLVCSLEDDKLSYGEMPEMRALVSYYNKHERISKEFGILEGEFLLEKIKEYEAKNHIMPGDVKVKKKKVRKSD